MKQFRNTPQQKYASKILRKTELTENSALRQKTCKQNMKKRLNEAYIKKQTSAKICKRGMLIKIEPRKNKNLRQKYANTYDKRLNEENMQARY